MAGQMTHSPCRVIAKLLVDLGLGAAPAAGAVWPVHWSKTPPAPDEVIVCRTTTPRTHGKDQYGDVVEDEGVQVAVRARTEQRGRTKAEAIKAALDPLNLRGVAVPASDEAAAAAYTVYAVGRAGGVIHLNKDKPANELDLFTLNLLVTVRRQS